MMELDSTLEFLSAFFLLGHARKISNTENHKSLTLMTK